MVSARSLRRIAFGLCVCALGAGLCFFAVLPALLESALVQADKISRSLTGQPLSFDSRPAISLFPLSFSFTGLHWGDASAPLTLSVRSGRATVNPWSLLDDFPVLKEVYLDGPVLTYTETPAPAALTTPNAAEPSVLGQSRTREKMWAQAGATLPVSLRLERLVIVDGSVNADAGDSEKLAISKLNLSARSLAGMSGTGEVECDFLAAVRNVSGELREANVALRGSVQLDLPAVEARLQASLTPLSGIYTETSAPASLDWWSRIDLLSGAFSVQRCLFSSPQLRATLTGNGTRDAEPAFRGRLAVQLSKECLSRLPIPATLPGVNLEGDVTVADHVLSMPSCSLSAGGRQATGSFTLGFFPVRLKGNVHCDELDLDAFVREEKVSRPAARSRLSTTNSDEAADGLPHFEIVFLGDSVTLRGTRLHDFELGLAGKDRVFTLSPVRATVGPGFFDAVVEFNLADMRWRCSGELSDISLADSRRLLNTDWTADGRLDGYWEFSGRRDNERRLMQLSGRGVFDLRSLLRREAETKTAEHREGGAESLAQGLPDSLDQVKVLVFADGKNICDWTARVTDSRVTGEGRGHLDVNKGVLSGVLSLEEDGGHASHDRHAGRVRGRPFKVQGTFRDPSFARDRKQD